MREELRRIFFVHKCVGCNKILEEKEFNEAFCEKCKKKYLLAKMDICPECALPAEECGCKPILLKKDNIISLRKLFFYRVDKAYEPQNKLVYFLKRRKSKRVLCAIAKELSQLLKNELERYDSLELPVIVSVPRSKSAIGKHGFDHADLICKELSNVSKIEYLEILKRRRGGKAQKKLTAGERRKNISNLIYTDADAKTQISGRCVLLFDDVVTTGASMSACVSALKMCGAEKVICFAIASDIKSS